MHLVNFIIILIFFGMIRLDSDRKPTTNIHFFRFILSIWATILLSSLITSAKGLDCAYHFDIRFAEPAHRVTIREEVKITNHSPVPLDTIYFHLTPNAYASTRSRYYQASENLLNEPLQLNIQSITGFGTTCNYKLTNITSLLVVLPNVVPVDSSIVLEIDYTIIIPEGNHPACPSYSGTDFRLIDFFPKVERLGTTGWTPSKYDRLAPSTIDPATFSLTIQLPDHYAVVSSLDIDTVQTVQKGFKTHRFQPAVIRNLAIVFSANQTVIPFEHKGVAIQIMLPKSVDRRFRLSKNTTLQRVTRSILDDYNARIVPYPHNHLAITTAKIPGGVTTANLIILGTKEINEIAKLDYHSINAYAQSIAEQYFHYYIFEDPDASDWIHTGLAGYVASNYMRGHYQDLVKNIQNKPADDAKPGDTLLRMATLAAAQENIGRPLQSRLAKSDTPLLVDQVQYFKSQKVLQMFQTYVGDSLFQTALLEFLNRYAYQPARAPDFIDILEQTSGKELALFEELWINSDNIPDIKIKRVKQNYNESESHYETRVIIIGDALKVIPAEIEAITKNLDTLRTVTGINPAGRDTSIFFSQFPLQKIALDPHRKIWEFNRLNNNYPSKVLFNFLIALPNIDAYQIFYYPTFDFNRRDAGRIGIKFRGRYWINMRPIFPSQSLDEWTLGLNYGIRSKTVGYDVSYSTSILALFFQPRIHFRSRDYFGLNETSVKSEIYIGEIKYPLLHRIQGYKKLNFGARYQNIRTLEFLNENSWQKGKLFNPFAEFINFHNWGDYRHITRVNFSLGLPEFDTDYRFQKLVFDTQLKYRPIHDIWLYQRIFLGVSGGQSPLQNYFYFFGKNTLENMSFKSFRLVKGAGDMRGYGANSPKGRNIVTSNTEIRWSYAAIEPTAFDLILFFDSGLISQSIRNINTGQLKFDAGIGTEFNALETVAVGMHIPFWVSHPVDNKNQFALRWVVSVDLNL